MKGHFYPQSLPQNFENGIPVMKPISDEINQSRNSESLKVRSDFRETWLWENIQTELESLILNKYLFRVNKNHKKCINIL